MKKERYAMEKQKKLRFNLVDVIFILVLLAGIAFVAMRLGGLDVVARLTGASAPEPYVITFTSTEVANYVVERVEIGSKVTDDEVSMNLGTVLDFQLGISQVSSAREDGQLVVSSKEGYSSINLLCQVQGSDNGNGVTVDGLALGVGHTMVVRAGDAKMYMVVCDIQKLSESPYANR